ncbi:MAG: hypothetical protein MUF84_20455 [Anaerolineae bacterium]|nr:hypothetical protein [Anaerolineae bacterium]
MVFVIGSGYVYYSMQVNRNLPVSSDAPSERRGLAIVRQYCAVGENGAHTTQSGVEQCRPIALLEVGDIVEVRLTAVLPLTRYYLRVEDPFPAGFEPIPYAVADVGAGPGPFGSPEFMDDRAVFFAEELAPGTYRVRYRLRAAVPGRYHAFPATAGESYSLEVWASSSIGVLEVLPHSP